MDKLESVKQKLIRNFNDNLVPFWDKMIDNEHGAFYGKWDNEPVKEADKGVIYLARLLWSFSVAYKQTGNIKFLSYSNYIYKFMITKLYDHNFKGFYYACDYKGKVINNHKHLYAQAFCLYGLSEFYDITKDENCLKIIFDLHCIIKQNFIDFPNRYSEEFTFDWEPTENKILMGYGMIPEITTNTLLHLIESLGTAYNVLQEEDIKNTCFRYLEIFFQYGINYENYSLNQFLDYNLNSVIDVISYGHDIEVSWLIKDVMNQIGCFEETYPHWHDTLNNLGKCSLNGLHNNYLLAEKINGQIRSEDIIWWVQAECLLGLLCLYQKNNNKEYLDLMDNLVNLIEKVIMTDNEWYWSVDKDGNPKDDHTQAEMWKANYHNFRCILKFMEV